MCLKKFDDLNPFITTRKKPVAKSKIRQDYDVIVSYSVVEVKLNPS